MSRCFPFPPPGYLRNGVRSEALIESIKLQRDREEPEKERKKEKKREKKEKRKERKLKDGRATYPSDCKWKESNISNLEYHQLEKTKAEGIVGWLQKRDDDDNERSGITEEHDQPFSSRELCCSSDATHSSKKRRSTSPSSHDHGTVIRIRLPLRKQREPEASQQDDRLVSTSSSESFPRETNGSLPQQRCFTSAEIHQCVQDSKSEECKGLGRLIQESAAAVSSGNSLENGSQSEASVYNSLFQSWVPPPIKFEGANSGNMDWLLGSELEERPISKKLKSAARGPHCSPQALWPRAQFLPEAEMYALPYAIPF
ncbi:hypothetical protein L6164_024881 [Bauhinia variegata]|uniref:Uncharacterized protein n=1 Tax=Bauhinia variegata TaxID=167791 RepID=A0ACB9LYZ4_BAUVA|nr:hypothetical protein L6164_024881 [Bauhinia variegata]